MADHDGVIIAVSGVIAEVAWLREPPRLHSVLHVEGDEKQIMVVYSSASASSVYCMMLTPQAHIVRGMNVVDTKQPLSIPVGEDVLGRAMNVFGHELDGQGEISRATVSPVTRKVTTTLADFQLGSSVLETGIKPIDFFTPLLHGGKAALVGGAGIGKTVILTELINRFVIQEREGTNGGQSAVFSAVGERSREALELFEDLQKANVLQRVSLIIGQMGENPAIRWQTAYGSASIAEYLRDELGHDVFFFMDNMYRFAQAGNELSTLIRNIPSEDGYQPTLASEMAVLNQRLSSRGKGWITSFMALFVPSDDLTDAAVRSVFPYLDTIVVLSRNVFQQGRYPAIDLLASSSSALNPQIVGEDHYRTYVGAKQVLERSAELERIVSLVGEGELSQKNQAVYARAKKIQNYLTQDLFLARAGLSDQNFYIPRSETVAGVAAILAGDYDSVAAEEFLFVGGIENVKKTQRVSAERPEKTAA